MFFSVLQSRLNEHHSLLPMLGGNLGKSFPPAWSAVERREGSDLEKWLQDSRRGAEVVPAWGSDLEAGR